ncbi:hypothetical protein [Marinobacter sp. BSs20148]|jgi:hypothetical protein|uniref:hypothetical protein n=1 Tax=Marinobacter sp. BSs20148 TaxID=490759 RepID=UPI00117EC7F7|nr:hypothetical protein [Marinobacter sp. BSs20148]
MKSGRLGKSNFFSTLIIGLERDGLFLGVCFPFNFGSKDLLIPLEEIQHKTIKGILFKKVVVSFTNHPEKKLEIPSRLAKKLNSTSGTYFFNVV